MIRPMTDEERQRAKEKAMANNERQRGDDLVKQLQNPRPMSMFLTRADQAKDWTELLHTAADRIEELSNCVAVLEAKLSKLKDDVGMFWPDRITWYRHFKAKGCRSRADYAKAADEMLDRATLAELLKERSGVATVSEAESDEKGQGDE